MNHEIEESIAHFCFAPKWKGDIPFDVTQHFDEILNNCPTKRYVTTEHGRFLFDIPNKKIYMIYRRYDVMEKSHFLQSLSIFIEMCHRKGITFFYEPAISN